MPILACRLAPRRAVRPAAPPVEKVRERYTKYEYRIPMRDGVRLFTAVYVPKDTSRTYPILLTRTPYSVAPYGADAYKDALGPSKQFEDEGYIFVYQDVRGRYMSEGEFAAVRPHVPDKRRRRTSTRAPTPTTPSSGCSRTCRTTTAGSAWSASRTPASTSPRAS